MIQFIIKYGNGNSVPVKINGIKRFVNYLLFKNIMAIDGLSSINAIEIKNCPLNIAIQLQKIISLFGISIKENIPFKGDYRHVIQRGLNRGITGKQSIELLQSI